MPSAITHDICVAVHTAYQGFQAEPPTGYHLFAYHIVIENRGELPVKLLSRRWLIVESNGSGREVTGEGVVGQQPLIKPGQAYDYTSACNLVTDMGKMYGEYTFERQHDHKLFKVEIPEFMLVAPFRHN